MLNELATRKQLITVRFTWFFLVEKCNIGTKSKESTSLRVLAIWIISEMVSVNRTSKNSARGTMAILIRRHCSIASSMWLKLVVNLYDSVVPRSILSEHYTQSSICKQKILNEQNVNFVNHSYGRKNSIDKYSLIRHTLYLSYIILTYSPR